MTQGCPFPECVLDDFHDGNHDFARPERPRGRLRLVQTFERFCAASPHCDLEKFPGQHRRAGALLMDELGFGWALCQACEEKFTNVQSKQEDRKTAGATPSRRPSLAKPQSCVRGKVIAFAQHRSGGR